MGALECHMRLNFCSVVAPNYDNLQELGKKGVLNKRKGMTYLRQH